MGDEFGHLYGRGSGFCWDAWGAGPFLMLVDGKAHLFEDSDRFGPFRCNKDGSVPKNDSWPPKHRFWVAHRAWIRAGRRLADDGRTCLWDEPKPTIVRAEGNYILEVIEHGDEELAGIFDQAGRMLMRPQSGPLS